MRAVSHFLRRRAWQSRFLICIGLAFLVETCFHASNFHIATPDHELDPPFHTSCQEPNISAPRENAVIVMLARNQEIDKALHSVVSLERRFNRWFQYPYVFLNDEVWSDEFKSAIRAATHANTTFETIPESAWTFPTWIDMDKAQTSIKDQGDRGVLYAGLTSYHHMCRFFSGYANQFSGTTLFVGNN